ncbi:hypothetical protein [Egbenema bharatensis]|uniref:hypothetical protein n=1 Tax=Egbenema bharatensis TaxID=3463334 RepID=UPI003A850234
MTEHFLDTSVVRPMLLGTQAYQNYFSTQFSQGFCYTSPYVQMEVKRSYLRNIIEFYFTLQVPILKTPADALTYWSNRYQGSKHKAVQQMMAQLLDRASTDSAVLQDKESLLICIEELIQEFVELLETQFINLENDSTACARAIAPFDTGQSSSTVEAIRRFTEAFDDTETCRRQCLVDQFILIDRRPEVEAHIRQAQTLPKNSNTRGFLRIAENLQEILNQGEVACSCIRRERIGDAVIALDAPRTMQLEHTDNSFDYLCPPIGQPHRKHPSETRIISGNGS